MDQRSILGWTLASLVLSGVAYGDRIGGPDDPPRYDKPHFKKSAQSIARADLLSCRNQDAVVTKGRDASAHEMARALHGIWVNRNGRTVHGRPVETDTAWYIDMRGLTGTAILLDRNNMGVDTLTAPFFAADGSESSLTKRARERLAVRPQRPLSMKQVNCTYEFVDEYIKVSDELILEALAATAPVRLTDRMTLRDVWKQLIAAGYFEVLEIPTSYLDKSKIQKVRASLGDGKRFGFTPEGLRVTEDMVAEGLVPGAEYELPMLVGAFFEITLTEREEGPGGYRSVFLRMEAEYQGTGINLEPGETVAGIEQGEFVMEGNAFVSARNISALDGFTTSTCADKNGLDECPVTGCTSSQTPPLADGVGPGDGRWIVDGKEVGTHLTTEFVFERMVIGVP